MHKALPFDQAVQEHGPGIKRAYTYKALNKLIQGSAADMTKKSMVCLYENGIIPHIQIHDEVDISVESDKISCLSCRDCKKCAKKGGWVEILGKNLQNSQFWGYPETTLQKNYPICRKFYT